VTQDFKFLFLNELNNLVTHPIDMSSIRLVNHVVFYDEKKLLITAGINGVSIFDFDYNGKYPPKLAAQVDMKGTYIKIKLVNQVQVEAPLEWCKGLKIDHKSETIITWNHYQEHQVVSFNSIGKLKNESTCQHMQKADFSSPPAETGFGICKYCSLRRETDKLIS
jgi:hypothetical protein